MAATSFDGRRTTSGITRRREARAGLLFVLPWLLSLLIFWAYPVLATIYLSFTDYNIVQPPQFIGLDNYSTIFTSDTDFWTSVSNSTYYALISVPLGLILSLLLALVLNFKSRGVGIYRTLFYLPALAPPVVATIVFLICLDPNNGPVNAVASSLGLPAPGWFTDPALSKPSLILLSLWGTGTFVLIFLAGLQEVPQSLLEAAMIDGAGPWQRFRHVTLPLLSPVVLFNLVIGVIYSFQVFTQAIIAGGSSGDPLNSTLVLLVLIYNNAFQYFKMGYASALSMLLFLVVMVLTLGIFLTSRAWVYYEGGTKNR